MKDVSRAVLCAVGADSRMELTEIAELAGCSRETVRAKLKRLEKDYGLWYTVELDEEKINLPFRYIIAARLRREPSEKEVRELLVNSSVPQFAATCSGEFDLLVYAATGIHLDYLRWEYDARRAFGEDLISWKASNAVFKRFGFIPLKEATLRALDLPAIESKVLAALYQNSRISLRKLAVKTGCTLMQARYAYEKLVKSGVIKRFTAVMRKPPMKSHVPCLLFQTFGKTHEEHSGEARKLIFRNYESELENRDCIVLETAGAADGFDCIAAADKRAAYGSVKEMEQVYKGSLRTESAEITKVLTGIIPARCMDVRSAYDSSSWRTKTK